MLSLQRAAITLFTESVFANVTKHNEHKTNHQAVSCAERHTIQQHFVLFGNKNRRRGETAVRSGISQSEHFKT